MAGNNLIVRESAKIIPLPQAIVWHEMAQQILAMACQQATKRGVLAEQAAALVVQLAKRLDTFHIRLLCDDVLALLEKSPA